MRDALQAISQEFEGLGLWEQHQQAVQALDQICIVVAVKQLQSQICEGGNRYLMFHAQSTVKGCIRVKQNVDT